MNDLVATTLRATDHAIDTARSGALRSLVAARVGASRARDLGSDSLDALTRGAAQATTAGAAAALSAARLASRHPKSATFSALLFGAAVGLAVYAAFRKKTADESGRPMKSEKDEWAKKRAMEREDELHGAGS